MREQFLLGSPQAPVFRGDARRWAITVQAGTPAQPVDLTGARLVFTVAGGPGETPLVQVQVTEHEDAATGKTAVTLTPEQTTAIPAGSWGCELRAVWDGGEGPRVWARGRMVVADALSGDTLPEVTP
ncbi:hypothetical protein [Megalodesulfovibrio paquesii]